MTHYRIEQSKSTCVPITAYSPITHGLLSMDKSTLENWKESQACNV